MKQKNKNRRSDEEKRMEVLKSGLCNELIAGVTSENGENEELPNLTEEEILAYIEECRANGNFETPTVGSLLCKVFDLVQTQKQLIEIVEFYSEICGQIEENKQPVFEKQTAPKAMPQENIRRGNVQRNYGKEQIQEAPPKPKSTGSTRQTMQKRGFIPKSQVDKMSREEIREMFDLIDKSRKEW